MYKSHSEFKSVHGLAAITFAFGFSVLGQARGQIPSGTSNFTIGTKVDANGQIPVTADWTTPLSLVVDGGDNLLANEAAIDVRIGPDANLFSITDLPSGPPGTSLGPLITLAPNSIVSNYGVLESYPQGYPSFNIPDQNNRTASIIEMASNTVVSNFGVMGFMPVEADDDYGGVATPCVISGTECNFIGEFVNNHGLIVGDTPATTTELPGPGMVVTNFGGAKMIAGGGSPVLGATSYNFQDGGLIDLKQDGSYCTHTGSGSNAYNWGYCLGIANGYWLDQGRGQAAYDYGGPLVPSSIDMDGNVVFNGTISSTYFEDPSQANSPCPAAYALQGAVHIVGDVTMNFFNTLYRVKTTGQIVNYLPLAFGFPLYSEPWNNNGQHMGPLSSTLNFNFAGLTPGQEQSIQNAVNAGSSSTAGSFTLDGQTYAWCPFMKVNVSFTDPIPGNGLNGFPTPGVSFEGQNGQSAYYIDPNNLTTNPYYLINAATVRLLGDITLQPGRTVISAGWTLVVGAQLTTDENGTLVTTDLDDAFSSNPSPSDSIHLEAGTAYTNGNINNVAGQTRILTGALVIDNPNQLVTLPNLTGYGAVMQEGAATTILAGTRNTIEGPIYIGNGTLQIASGAAFATPPHLIIGVNDSRQTFPTFDISELTAGENFVVADLQTAGPQIQTGQVGKPIWYPIIKMGASNLIVGSGSASNSKFIGGLVGTGSLSLAPNSFLDLGGVSAFDFDGNQPVLISTYSGGTQIGENATLMLENLFPIGTGPVTNAGSLLLGSSVQYLLQQNGLTAPPATANPLHTINIPAAYTQTSSGSVTLRIAGSDIAGQSGSGAGYNYDFINAAGPVSLSGALNLRLIGNYIPPRGGATFTILKGQNGITGDFSQINVIGKTRTFIVQQEVTPTTITVTLTPN